MKSTRRDLLVLSKNTAADQREIDSELEKLHELLFTVECVENFCLANEIIDVNKYRIISNPIKIEKIISKNKMKPFQFINNKN